MRNGIQAAVSDTCMAGMGWLAPNFSRTWAVAAKTVQPSTIYTDLSDRWDSCAGVAAGELVITVGKEKSLLRIAAFAATMVVSGSFKSSCRRQSIRTRHPAG